MIICQRNIIELDEYSVDWYNKIHNINNELTIGNEFDLESYLNEVTIVSDNLPKIDKIKIHVYENEGTIPHFHIDSIDGKFKRCICIYDNNYFDHGKYQDKLANDQAKALDQLLRTKLTICNVTKSVWDHIALAWELANGDNPYNKQYENYTKQSNYSDINRNGIRKS